MEQQDTCKCGEELRIRCKGECFQTNADGEHCCHAYGQHAWCENYMVKLSLGKPEFFEEK